MKYILFLFLISSTIFANPQFVQEESSVFDKKIETVIEEVKEEKTTFESTSQSPTSLEQTTTFSNAIAPVETINQKLLPKKKEVEILAVDVTSDDKTDDEVLAENIEETLQTQETMNIVKDYFSEVIMPSKDGSKNLYASFIHSPETIYKNQRFEIIVKTLVTTDDFDRIETRFINGKNMIPLNPENVWSEVEQNSFENRYFFKAYDSDFVMPTLQILLYKYGIVKEFTYLAPKEVVFSEIAKDDEKFSNVIAQELTVKAYKSKQYNNNELITILDVEANESNLEDFHLNFVEEQGFSNIVDNYPEQKMLYYLVMPIHKKKIEFNYYSSGEKRLKTIIIPIQLENELVSTQTDLNPNNSNILLYKKIALSILVVIFLGLFIWKRNYIYLSVLLLVLIVLILYMMPNRQAFIKGDTTIYILPTKNSTIFYKTTQTRVAEVVMKKAGFVKVMMNVNNKKIIGWIKEGNLVEN